MKFLTLNIWNGGKVFPAVLEFLKQQSADIFFLQEVNQTPKLGVEPRFQTTAWLRENFPDYFIAYAPALIDTRKIEGEVESGHAILSRWPLQNPTSFFVDIPPGKFDHDSITDFSSFPSMIQQADVLLEGQVVRLLNVHGPVNFDGMENNERRQKFISLIQRQTAEYTIVAGDSNAQPDNPCFLPLTPQLQSVFGNTLPTTFNGARKDLVKFPGYATASVDVIWTTSNLKVSAPRVWTEADVSDHLALSAEIAII